MNALILAIALTGQGPAAGQCPTETTVTVSQETTSVEITERSARRHPVARAVKAIGKGLNHLRPFHRGRRCR